MVELPSGTVTLLFSDMEGSTRLLARLGPNYAKVLSAQREILREVWSSHGGVEVGTEGDSFFVAFASASSGVAAAVQAQRRLADIDVVEADRPRVRIGLHTGAPLLHDGGYVGMDVHRAARISAAAHGGQVLVSEATAVLVRQEQESGIGLLDLGSHQLKDIPRPEHLFQAVAAGLGTRFPAIRTLGMMTRLPVTMTPLVGRDGEMRELVALVGTKMVRLVTLTGPGGSGKTRLAIALAERLADRFADGVFFVPLATVSTAEVMWTTIADAMDLPPEGKLPPGLFDHVGHRVSLMVLDNLEQIDGADGVVSDLLTQAPHLVVIVTSRHPLHLRAEHEHPVPPLTLPDEPGMMEISRSAAVQMFVQQAAMVKPSFALTETNADAVVEICKRLDGLPLAIELAAARTKLLSPQALVARLDQSLDLALRAIDRPGRQQTLRETIAWSYDLLTPVQQTFFDYLGVFVGGADLEAVVAVVPGESLDGADHFDLIAELADANLLVVAERADGEPRVRLLETIGAFARERLDDSGRFDDARRRHARYFADYAERSRRSDMPVDGVTIESFAPVSIEWAEANLDNVRAALDWALPSEFVLAPDAQRLAVGLTLNIYAQVALLRQYPVEAEARARRALRWAAGSDTIQAARTYSSAATAARTVGDWKASIERAREAAVRADRFGDLVLAGYVQQQVINGLINLGEVDQARQTAEHALVVARDLNNPHLAVHSLSCLALLASDSGDLELSMQLEQEALDLSIELGWTWFVTVNRQNLGCSLRALGRPREALVHFAAITLEMATSRDQDWIATFAEDVACALVDAGNLNDAARLFGSAEALRVASGSLRPPTQDREIRDPLARGRLALAADWDAQFSGGSLEAVADVLIDLLTSGALGPVPSR